MPSDPPRRYRRRRPRRPSPSSFSIPRRSDILHEPGAGGGAPPETLVQDLWRYGRFDASSLTTVGGEPVLLLDPGELNTDEGPDFRHARLTIGGRTVEGDVELHVYSSGWVEHGHHHDPRYGGVVLHVTLYPDVWTGHLQRIDGGFLPEVVLAPRLDTPLRSLLFTFRTRRGADVACAAHLPSVPPGLVRAWAHRLSAERVRRRCARLLARHRAGASVEQLLHEGLFAALGYAKNVDPMRLLARRLPLPVVRGIEDDLDLEALHFGSAGLLPSPAELLGADRSTADRAIELRDRFERLAFRIPQTPLPRTAWRYFRLRPANFPPARIAQAVALLSLAQDGLLRRDPLPRLRHALAADDATGALLRLLRPPVDQFWETHLHLDRPCPRRRPEVGPGRALTLVTNVVVPILAADAELRQDAGQRRRAERLLKVLPPDRDEVTRRFARLGISPGSASETQGLHQLYRTRCRRMRCLACAVGRYILDRP